MKQFSAFKRTALIVASVLVGLLAYYFVSRQIYFAMAKAAFPQAPISADCYFLPWPVGPTVIGQLAGDDPLYLNRHAVNRQAQGLHLTIHDSNGSFIIEPE